MLSPIPQNQKRKREDDGDNGDDEEIHFATLVRSGRNEPVSNLDQCQHRDEAHTLNAANQVSAPGYEAPNQTFDLPIRQSGRPGALHSVSPGHDVLNEGPPPEPSQRFPSSAESPRAPLPGEWSQEESTLGPARFPDLAVFSDTLPDDILDLPSFLFRPRLPPPLPQLSLRFRTVLYQHRRLAKLVDRYQRWHGLSVFAFWTDEDLARAASGRAPELARALDEDRPQIPPRVLETRFEFVLRAAPLLSHLIWRYHIDLGYEYFAFYHADPRGPPDNSEFPGSVSQAAARAHVLSLI